MTQVTLTQDELATVESSIVDALDRRDVSALNVLGYGEVSVAVGWPALDSRMVCKRLAPATRTQFVEYEKLLTRYLDELPAIGIAVVDTSLRGLERDGKTVPYLVQPLLDPATLGDNILRDAEPDTDHPLLGAIADAINSVGPTISVDAQVSNWTWDGEVAHLLDVGTPFLFEPDGTPSLDITPFMAMLPMPLRPLVHRDLRKLLSRWREPRGVAVDVVANLYRSELDHWVEPVIEAFNRTIAGPEPIRVEEADAIASEDRATFPRIKKMQKAERLWRNSVRRGRYEFFIQNSYDGTIE